MTTLENLRKAARELPPIKQMQLIQELLQGLQEEYHGSTEAESASMQSPPIPKLNDLAVDFWSDTEVVEEPNCFVPSRLRERAIGS